MEYELTEQIKTLDKNIKVLEKLYMNWVGVGAMREDDATNQILVMKAVLETLKQVDIYGGLPKLRHKYKAIERYKVRYKFDEKFREERKEYFRKYYCENKDRIKIRNINRDIGRQNESVHLRKSI